MKTLFKCLMALAVFVNLLPKAYSQSCSRNHYLGVGIPTPPATFPTTYPYHVKNFSIGPHRTNTPQLYVDLYVASATIFADDYLDEEGYPIGKGIFYYGFLSDGHGVSCNSIDLGTGISTTNDQINEMYDDPNYDDERSVAIVTSYSSAEEVIIAQVRNATTHKYGMKILHVDECSGDILKDKIVMVGSSENYDNLHPLDAVYNPYDGYIYICGYVNSTGNKSAFVAKYDPVASTIAILGYDWYPGPGMLYDFDIAIHLKILNNGSNAGNIAVLGSSNIIPNSGGIASGSLVMILDQNLNLLQKISLSDQPSISQHPDEYAYDIEEEQQNGGFFVYSNKFTVGPQTAGPIWFNPTPEYPVITYLNSNLQIPGSANQRAHIYPSWYTRSIWAWGSTVVNGNYIAGFQSFWNDADGCATNGNITPSFNNILPFLSQINLGWNGSTISANINFWKIYFTQAPEPNFYPLGGELSNISWPTKFAVGNPNVTNNIMMVPPIRNNLFPSGSPSNKMTFKFLRTDNAGDIDPGFNNCENTYTNCVPDVHISDAYNGEPETEFTDVGFASDIFDGGSVQITNLWVGDLLGCEDFGYYKPTEVNNLVNHSDINIYPNPAQDYISISLTKQQLSIKNITVEIYSSIGQKIGILYKGSAKELDDKKLILNDMAPGVKLIRITSDWKLIGERNIITQ
jgi:hypothetical protein